MTDAAPAVAPAARDRSIDVLKGIGMVVVIMGHLDASGIGGSFVVYLYSFNVALFFVVAGYMWRDKPGVGFLQITARKFRQIYVPYIVLFVISLLYGHLVVRYLYGEYVIPFGFRATAKAFLFASDWLNSVPTFNFALWFLPIFFISTVAFQLMQKARNRLVVYIPLLVALMLVSPLVQQVIPGRPPLTINVLPVALAFMGCGHLIRRWLDVRHIPVIALVPLFAFTLVISYCFGGNVESIGTILYFPSALASFVVYLRIAMDLESSRFLGYVGRNSLIIFGIHGLVANTYTHTRIPEAFGNWNGLMTYLINVAYVVLVSVFLVKSYRLAKAFLLGRLGRQRLRVVTGTR